MAKILLRLFVLLLIAYGIFWVIFEFDLNTRCIHLIQEEEYARAIEICTQAIESRGEYLEAQSNRGVAHFYLGNLDAALADTSSYIEKRLDDASAIGFRCVILTIMGNTERAIEDCNRAIEIAPENAQSYLRRGNIWLENSQWEHAIDDYTSAIEHSGDAAWRTNALAARAIAYQLSGESEAALADAHAAVETKTDYAVAYLARGSVLWLRGDPEASQRDFDQYLNLQSDSAPTLALHMDAIRNGTYPSTRDVYLRMANASPPNTDTASVLEATRVDTVSNIESSEPATVESDISVTPSDDEMQPSQIDENSSVSEEPVENESWLNRTLPPYAHLIGSGVLLLIFTGAYAVVDHVDRFRKNPLIAAAIPQMEMQNLVNKASRLKFRRITALVFALLVGYNFITEVEMPYWWAGIIALFFLDSAGNTSQLRKDITAAIPKIRDSIIQSARGAGQTDVYRGESADALRMLGDPAALPYLKELATSENEDVRRKATLAIQRLSERRSLN
jgi:tetratricopeptide (TPR) repeat protein